MISSYVVDLLGFNERMATSSIIFTSGAVLLQTAVPFYLLTNKIHSNQHHRLCIRLQTYYYSDLFHKRSQRQR